VGSDEYPACRQRVSSFMGVMDFGRE